MSVYNTSYSIVGWQGSLHTKYKILTNNTLKEIKKWAYRALKNLP